MSITVEEVTRRATGPDEPDLRGSLHRPSEPNGAAIVLAHGAGSDRNSDLLRLLCQAFAERGTAALRIDLPYRQKRPKGPPSPSGAARDRAGFGTALEWARNAGFGPVFAGGSSYGGRQASMLIAEQQSVADGLLLLSYPLHPPGKPERRRDQHLPALTVPTLFAHGDRDAFGSAQEMAEAAGLPAGPSRLLLVNGARHGLVQKRDKPDQVESIVTQVVAAFLEQVRIADSY